MIIITNGKDCSYINNKVYKFHEDCVITIDIHKHELLLIGEIFTYYYNIYDIGIITHNKVLKQCKYNGILIIQFEDRIEYYKNGLLHSDNGRYAVKDNNIVKWYKEGQIHRLDGPAVIHKRMV